MCGGGCGWGCVTEVGGAGGPPTPGPARMIRGPVGGVRDLLRRCSRSRPNSRGCFGGEREGPVGIGAAKLGAGVPLSSILTSPSASYWGSCLALPLSRKAEGSVGIECSRLDTERDGAGEGRTLRCRAGEEGGDLRGLEDVGVGATACRPCAIDIGGFSEGLLGRD